MSNSNDRYMIDLSFDVNLNLCKYNSHYPLINPSKISRRFEPKLYIVDIELEPQMNEQTYSLIINLIEVKNG